MSSGGPVTRDDSLAVSPPEQDVEDRRLMHDVASRLFGRERRFQIDRFEIERRLGAGASGVVYLARDPRLERRVALKAIHRPADATADVASLLREARAAAKLDHPHLVTVYEVGEAEDCVWIAMQLVEGSTLREWWQRDGRTTSEVVRLFADVADGLAAAHRAGLVHRDFKPENVLVGEEDGRDVARVADFGLARDLEVGATAAGPAEVAEDEDAPAADVHHLTRTGALAGTPRYMAPEQFRGGRVGPEADQFAFFVALYEALQGHRPFPGETMMELRAAVEQGAVRGLSNPLPGWLDRAIRRGLSPDPARRWPDMAMVANQLREEPRQIRTRRVGALVTVGLLATGFGISSVAAPPPDPCVDSARASDETWSDERRAALASATAQALGDVEATGSGDRLVAALDAHFDRWADARVATCQARERRELTEASATLRVECLHRILAMGDGFVGGLLDQLADPSDVALALQRIDELPGPGRCDDPEVLARAVPVSAEGEELEAIEALSGELDTLEGRLLSSEQPPPEAELADLLERATSTSWRPLIAQAQLLVAKGYEARGDVPAAIAAAEASLAAAVEGADAPRAARAALALAWYEGEGRRDVKLAERWLGLADAHVLAAGAPPRERITALEHRALFAHRRGDLEAALTGLQRSIELRSSDPELAAGIWRVHNEMATAHFAAGQFEEAAGLFERAAKDLAEALGPDHPLRARTLSNLGIALQRLGRSEEARDALVEALETKRRALGKRHLSVASTLNNLAPLEAARADRIARYREAIDIVESELGPDSPRLANATYNLARELLADGQADAALEGWQRFTQIRRAQHGDEHADVIIGEVTQTEALRALGRSEDALAISRKWVDRLDAAEPPALGVLDQAEILIQHARNLRATEDEVQARVMAQRLEEVCLGTDVSDCVPEDLASLLE